MINDLTEEIYEKLLILIDSSQEFRTSVSSLLVADPDSEGVIQREILVDVVFLAINFCLRKNFPSIVAQSLLALIAEEFVQDNEEIRVAETEEQQNFAIRSSILSKVSSCPTVTAEPYPTVTILHAL